MANIIAYFVLLGWPVFVSQLFKRNPLNKAIILSILLGYLLLPVGLEVDFPLIPPFNKESIPSLAVFFILRYILGKRVPSFSKPGLFDLLLLVFLLSPIITVLMNSENVYKGSYVIPGLGMRDIISIIIRQWIILIPLFLGRQFLKEPKDLKLILQLLTILGLAYSLLVLFEIRMSPQLHRWIYGYHSVGFGQQKRGGGFRSTVFLGHGLWVSFYMLVALWAATMNLSLKQKITKSVSNKKIIIYLFIVLLFNKSLGSLVYALIIIPLIYWEKVGLISICIRGLVIVCILYPMLRVYNYFPIEKILEWAYSYDAARGQSLQFRFDQEHALLARAKEKLLSGWGGWGRNRVYDAETGADISITDGRWIITMGIYGLIGFIAEFGLLLYPAYKGASLINRVKESKDKILIIGFSLMLVIYVVDLLPNDPLSPLTWLIAGALMGNIERLKKNYG